MQDTPSRLIVISGLSGAGKTVALHTLEDLGYYCIDNLPMQLLPEFARSIVDAVRASHRRVALGVDSRSPEHVLQDVPGLIAALNAAGMEAEIVFLDASDQVLMQRFSETRRKHPLSGEDVPLIEAMARERQLLAQLAEHAAVHIDTSHTSIHQLRDLIRGRIDGSPAPTLSLNFTSFGFKKGIPPDADLVFDARCLPNPYWEPRLRDLSGKDDEVVEFLHQSPAAEKLFDDIARFVKTWMPQYESGGRAYMTVAIGCTGGQHRSVWLAEKLGAEFDNQQRNVVVRHRELGPV